MRVVRFASPGPVGIPGVAAFFGLSCALPLSFALLSRLPSSVVHRSNELKALDIASDVSRK